MKGGTAAAVRKRKKTNSIAATDSKPTFSRDSAAGGGAEGMALHSKKLRLSSEIISVLQGRNKVTALYHHLLPAEQHRIANVQSPHGSRIISNHACESETGEGMQAAFPNKK